MELPEISDFRELFLQDRPLLDVRAPVEFADGAFPSARNLPLLTDRERHLIGIRYKESGQASAIDLGRELIDGEPREQRVAHWKRFIEQHPQGALYCFRGGMRSRITQEWIYAATGVAYPRVKGGYKALRRYLLEELDRSITRLQPLVVGGRTGAGKTILLKQLDHAIDLEGLAWHRGSAFGRHATPQPTQIDFENRLSIELMKHLSHEPQYLLLEDESRAIGSRHLPPALYECMSRSPLVVLEVSLEERIDNSIDEYVIQSLAEYQQQYGQEQGFERWEKYTTESLARISKRLGGVRFQQLEKKLTAANQHMKQTGSPSRHRDWIEQLLSEYYDPMYDYQIEKKRERIIFSGNMPTVLEYLKQL